MERSQSTEEGVHPKSNASEKRKADWFEIDDSHNTYVYVSGLPKTITEEEFIDLMSKGGIIAKKPMPGNPLNIKMYRDKDGSLKGDALCCYVRKESVDNIILYLDGYLYDGKYELHCERAKFQMKGDSYDPSKKPRLLDKRTKLKHKKKIDKLLSWEEKEDKSVSQTRVILKNMFTLEELAEDASLILEIKEDVETKCTELIGQPKRVDVYDANPDGVVAVTFAEQAQAEACVKALDKMPYACRLVKAELWDGKTKYKMRETDEESSRRLQKWHEDIQKSDDDGENDAANDDLQDKSSASVDDTNQLAVEQHQADSDDRDEGNT